MPEHAARARWLAERAAEAEAWYKARGVPQYHVYLGPADDADCQAVGRLLASLRPDWRVAAEGFWLALSFAIDVPAVTQVPAGRLF